MPMRGTMRNVDEQLEDLRSESVSLNADNLALQTLLFSLMISLHKSDALATASLANASG